MIEGQGIWLELVGTLTDGSLDDLAERLDRLAELKFTTVVLGATAIDMVDAAGALLLACFVDRIVDAHGSVLVVDPDGAIRPIVGGLTRAQFTSLAPTGTWWIT